MPQLQAIFQCTVHFEVTLNHYLWKRCQRWTFFISTSTKTSCMLHVHCFRRHQYEVRVRIGPKQPMLFEHYEAP